jgi:acyl-CoA thioesterase FadM
MNLWLRLLWYALSARWRPALALPGGVSRLAFRVWPHDLDPSLHLNNGRYLALMDLGRLDVLVTSGLWRAVLRHRWTPIASAITIRFRRELRLFQSFQIETRIVGWAGAHVIMEQVFVVEGENGSRQIAAQALFKGGIYDRQTRSFVTIARLMQEIGAPDTPSPSLDPAVETFLRADEELRRAATSR